ncbi:MAG: exosortase/archaeosortase family protein [Planctomycetes bacterium]|nr:exosortase/archaeosortase family protein [Planctomycetota bacterium]
MADPLIESPQQAAEAPPAPTGGSRPWLVMAAVLAVALGWAYWSTLVGLFNDWQGDEDYSVGQLVPLVAVYLLWRYRGAWRQCTIKPCWAAVAVILLAQAVRMYGLLFIYESAERYALVLTIMGLVMFMAGWQVFRRLFWVLAFLLLMVPLPGRVHNMISGPLQGLATAGAVFMLEVFGVTVARHGNVMMLNNSTPLAVAEACSGLRMLTAFIVVSATMAFMVDRPRWQKITLLVSSVPIAIISNLVRLCITAVLFLVTDSQVAEKFFHDFAGLTMMPLAVMLLFGELWLMNKLVLPDRPSPPDAAAGPS